MRTIPQAAMSSVDVASCILAHRMHRSTLTDATGFRTSMPDPREGDEAAEESVEVEDALPLRDFIRELGIVGRTGVKTVCVFPWSRRLEVWLVLYGSGRDCSWEWSAGGWCRGCYVSWVSTYCREVMFKFLRRKIRAKLGKSDSEPQREDEGWGRGGIYMLMRTRPMYSAVQTTSTRRNRGQGWDRHEVPWGAFEDRYGDGTAGAENQIHRYIPKSLNCGTGVDSRFKGGSFRSPGGALPDKWIYRSKSVFARVGRQAKLLDRSGAEC
jgi:hypothetical protein